MAGLARSPRADQGHRLDPDLQRFVEGRVLQRPAPTAAAIHRQVVQIATDHGWTVPSYRTVAAIIHDLDPALVTLAQEGSTVYRETFDLLYRHEAQVPNAVWQADHTPLDIRVLDDAGRTIRPWLTVILDDYSRAVAGFRLSAQAPSALQTALTLRQAIWRKGDPRWQVCGIPQTFYTDHGSDFTSGHLEQVAADLKMVLVFSEVGRPRGRGKIERFFQTINTRFLGELPGWHPPKAKPAAPVLTLRELAGHLATFILDDYHHQPHGETGERPHDRWAAGGFLPQMPDSLEQLDLLLLTEAKPRRVQQDGIHFQGLRYLDLMLAAYVGETVVIRYDPSDVTEVRVFHEGRFLCRAICQDLADYTISLPEIVEARTQRRRQVRQAITERTRVVDQILGDRATPDVLAIRADDAPRQAASRPAVATHSTISTSLKRYENE